MVRVSYHVCLVLTDLWQNYFNLLNVCRTKSGPIISSTTKYGSRHHRNAAASRIIISDRAFLSFTQAVCQLLSFGLLRLKA